MKTTLNNLTIGQDFKLDTKDFYTRLHIYTLVSNDKGVFVYVLKNDAKYNQKTTTKLGKTKVVVI